MPPPSLPAPRAASPIRFAILFAVLYAALSLSLAACGSVPFLTDDAPPPLPPDSTRAYTLFLIGDVGSPKLDRPDPTLSLLQSQLDSAEAGRSGVVFLGDNIYPSGLPARSSPRRPNAEARIRAQLSAVEDFGGRILFVPGNHDYGGQGLGGEQTVLRRQERFVEEFLGRGNTFAPSNGFPGPVEIELADSLTLVALDTQWWLEARKRRGDTGAYVVEGANTVVRALEDVFRRRPHDRIVVVGHHPFYSNGSHGGYKPGRAFFPIPLARRYLGTPQDLSNQRYRTMRNTLTEVFAQHPGLIYASGHEHTLQYFPKGDQHYIVSGAGSKSDYVVMGNGAAFVDEGKGYGRLLYYTDGAVWLEFWKPTGEEGTPGRLVYRARLEAPTDASAPRVPAVAAASMPDSVTVPARRGMQRGGPFHGQPYRAAWRTPVRVPVLHFDSTAGGLALLGRSGRFGATALRFRGADGSTYRLRPIDPEPETGVPKSLRRTLAQPLATDVPSARQPYGPLVVAPLAEAGGITQPAPRLVYIPDHPRLGRYRDGFANTTALFEREPYADAPLPNTATLLNLLRQDPHRRVDQRAFARARLFDMLIGDVNRPRDHWRWTADTSEAAGTVYRPVALDRSFAFFRFEGPVAFFLRTFGGPATRVFQNQYGPDFGDVKNLNARATDLDRRLTAALTRADWLAEAERLRDAITDEVIEQAVRQLPEAAFATSGDALRRSLMSRRNQLAGVAGDYYEVLAGTVDVVGSDQPERFTVRRVGGQTEVAVASMTDGETEDDAAGRLLYRRTFSPGETDEIRLYGLDGDDVFVFEGEGERDGGPRIRAIGGEGDDTFRDASPGGRAAARAVLYDTPERNTWENVGAARIVRSYQSRLNEYPMESLRTPTLNPTAALRVTVTDGLTVGAGVTYTRPGFRASPYGQRHRVSLSYATRSNAVRFGYAAHLPGAFRHTGEVFWQADVARIGHFRQFYGFGNNSRLTDRPRFDARVTEARVSAALHRTVLQFAQASLGPTFTLTDVALPDDAPRQSETGYAPDDLRTKAYLGLRLRLAAVGLDTLSVTQSGARWVNEASVHQGVFHTRRAFLRLSSALSYFYTFDVFRSATLALRAGGATNLGQFEFYQANTLGGLENLRGFRRSRFAGHTHFFTNAELRLPLLDFDTPLTRGLAGVLAFLDQGRVWTKGESSRAWHRGYGGGVWVSPYHDAVLTLTAGFSDEEKPLVHFRLGFLF